MKKKILLFLFIVTSSFVLNAQLFCPENIVVSCLSDLTPDECGMATVVSGNYHPSMVKYVDQNETNACNEGIVYRTFYLDIDYNNTFTDNEPSCIQTITLEYFNLPLNLQFPSDKEYTCVDEIPVDHPTWQSNPCDLIGYTYEDDIFEFEQGACLKIVRTYHVINWCVYDVNTQDGLYEGIQIIKIIDNQSPEIDDCGDQYFDSGANCEAMVTLVNSATDSGDCPSGTLTWRVSVDLWADGTEDLFYGPNEPEPYRLDPVENGANVKIVIPEALGVAKHKVVWKVTDGCGNVRTCPVEFFVEDNKPPTPYCLNFTSSTLNGAEGWTLTIPATFFNIDAVDNCSAKEDIILSFSENIEDTERVIECGDTGFQFFRIYYTDEAGNQDFCEVFMLIFDNGSCSGRYAPSGSISKPNGQPIAEASAYLLEQENIVSQINSNDMGYFSFGEQDLVEEYKATIKKEGGNDSDVDIEDFILMRSALIGLEELDFYQKVAADINQDNLFDKDDLYEFRDVLLDRSNIEPEDTWTFIPKMYDMSSNPVELEVEENIPYSSYGLGFDFYGIRTGDLTGSIMNEIVDESENEEIDLTLEISNNIISIISNQDFESDAYQFDLAVFGSQLDDNYNTENISFKATENGQRIVNLEKSQSISKDQVLMSMNIEIYNKYSIEEIIKTAKIFQLGNINPAKVNWIFVDKRHFAQENFESLLWRIYPLPMTDQLNINATNISKIALFSISGQYIDIDTIINEKGAEITITETLPHGVYFLKVTTATKERIIKVVR